MSVAPTQAPTDGVAFERPRVTARVLTGLAVVAGLALVAWSIYVRTRAFTRGRSNATPPAGACVGATLTRNQASAAWSFDAR